MTGEAEYTDDVPMPPNGLHAAIVMSTKPHARILSIDTTKAEAEPGFEGYFDARDVPGGNDIGAVMPDEELFATEFVTCVGQVGYGFFALKFRVRLVFCLLILIWHSRQVPPLCCVSSLDIL